MSCKPRVYSSAYRPVNTEFVNVEGEYIIYMLFWGGYLLYNVVLRQRSKQVNGSLIIPVLFDML